ncbi:MAG TPA: SCO1664 family protein [Anaerolineales bacterium]|nr:SCO1664 family protein [Anaerolineales bacterium]
MKKTDQTILTALEKGQMTVLGEYLWGSNYTFSVQVQQEGLCFQGVYKPTRGERPLWDFPRSSLAKREVAAYLVSEFLGWRLVPPTVYRKDAPVGPGSLQLYIEHDPEYHYFNFKDVDRQRLRPVALFDLLINNADRKGSHVLFDAEDHIWLIDHGICFHREEKLRTVIWDFAGEPIPLELCSALERLMLNLTPECQLTASLLPLLNREEIAALGYRAQALTRTGKFPDPHPNRRPYPWPPV